MKVLNRRNFLGNTSKLALTGLVTAKALTPVKAFAMSEDGLTIESEISNNHGHALEMNSTELIKHLRSLEEKQESKALVSIQGQSHPHDIELTSSEMISIILGEEITKTSVGGNHSHDVLIRLNAE